MIQIGINIAVKGAGVSGPPSAPVNTVLPNVTGVAIVGDILTTDDGSWTGSPTSYAYQWKRGATNIGTNANTYTLVNADAGQSITCVVTATNGGGSTPATSNALTIQNFFTTEWTTTANSEQIFLPYTGTGTYSGTIDWGDGNTDTNSYANLTHTYATAGTYTVIITGDCIGWDMGNTISGSTYWTSVVNWGQLQLGTDNFGYNFYGCPNLDLSSVQGTLDLTGVTNFDALFFECFALTTVNNINSWDTSAITTMVEMFSGCTLFNQALSFDTSAVEYMNNMFSGCTSFNQALSFNTSAVTSMNAMFQNTTNFNSALNLNTSAVLNMAEMFDGCTAFNQPLTFNTSAVTSMNRMFKDATAFNQNIGTWDVANVTNFSLFMTGKTPATFSTTNLNAIYNGWSTQAVQPSLTIDFGTAKYTAAATAGRLVLTGTKLWTITDGGL